MGTTALVSVVCVTSAAPEGAALTAKPQRVCATSLASEEPKESTTPVPAGGKRHLHPRKGEAPRNRRCVLPPWRRWAVQLVTFSSEGSGGGLPLRCGANPSSCLPSELSRPRYACSAPPVTRCSASHVVDVFCRVSRPWVAALLVAQLRPRPWSLDLALVVFPSDASQLV